jgi:hypothetical protein
MFDFLNHWFAKTINNGGKIKTHFSRGHYSLDLTFIVIVILILICVFTYFKIKNFCLNQHKKSLNQEFQLIPLKDVVCSRDSARSAGISNQI